MATFRSVLEVLKWACCSDLCDYFNQVSCLWGKAANSDEVWDTLCEAYGYDSRDSGETVKLSFLRQYHETTIYMLSEHLLRGIDVRKRAWKPAVYVDLDIPFDKLSSIVIFQLHIVITGTNGPRTGQSVLIHTTTGLVTPLPNMLFPRSRHGSLLYKGTVYVFAGSDIEESASDTAEKLDVRRPRATTTTMQISLFFPLSKGTNCLYFGGLGNK